MLDNSIYSFSAKDISGTELSFDQFKDKVILIVNTASECGFTPQYEGLEVLHNKYKDQGLVILGFPCNQFGGQEPGDESQIKSECLINYGVSFQMFSKIDVNGDNTHPLYEYLKSEKSNMLIKKVKWNFEKFLLNKNGQVVDRYASIATPEKIEKDIIKLL
jgi:glutathione peroxidase